MPAAAPAQDLGEVADMKACTTPVIPCVQYYIERGRIIIRDGIGDACWLIVGEPCTLPV
jgi:hypothetical protein